MSISTTPSRPASPPPRLKELRDALSQVSSRDFGRLLGRWRGLSRKPDPAKLDALAADICFFPISKRPKQLLVILTRKPRSAPYQRRFPSWR